MNCDFLKRMVALFLSVLHLGFLLLGEHYCKTDWFLRLYISKDKRDKKTFAGANEHELDWWPWLTVSALISMVAFIFSLIIYYQVKRRQGLEQVDILPKSIRVLLKKNNYTLSRGYLCAKYWCPGQATAFWLQTTILELRALQMVSCIYVCLCFPIYQRYTKWLFYQACTLQNDLLP